MTNAIRADRVTVEKIDIRDFIGYLRVPTLVSHRDQKSIVHPSQNNRFEPRGQFALQLACSLRFPECQHVTMPLRVCQYIIPRVSVLSRERSS
ncbi:uncharacterized protein LAJ45_08737 [Morchella importuna]|uniref:uncharacterized protein n=1 Tax=Morchella importuna TaxID=1174673 RepID=UPI001E8CAF51|nr:uncharacterized protein LAJ45_08737 [Morchella importuna]KAH8147259.1 hypothetical protein LAJ45_08737 [Morchella importuna]